VSTVSDTFAPFIDFLFPTVCGACRRLGPMLCDDCRAAVEWLAEPICMSCGRPTPFATLHCHRCEQRPLPLNQIRAAVLFTDPVAQLIHLMKYEGYFALAESLADLMVTAWPRWQTAVNLVLPIPLAAHRERKRGYNQSELLTRQLAQKMGWATSKTALKRTRYTRPQVGLDAEQRRRNLQNAFTAEAAELDGKHILLVDDVCTTGATLVAAAEAITAVAAPASISAYCLARASLD
jgi:ComF family protein